MNCDFVRKLGISSRMSNVHIVQVSGRTMGLSGKQRRSQGAFRAREDLGGGSSVVHQAQRHRHTHRHTHSRYTLTHRDTGTQGCRSVCSQVPQTGPTAVMSFNPATVPGTATSLQKARPGH